MKIDFLIAKKFQRGKNLSPRSTKANKRKRKLLQSWTKGVIDSYNRYEAFTFTRLRNDVIYEHHQAALTFWLVFL